MLSLWVTYLRRLYQNNKEFCVWFLQAMISAAERQKQILLTCPDLNIRIAFAEIIATAFQVSNLLLFSSLLLLPLLLLFLSLASLLTFSLSSF
jgi:hypothetical protein